MKMPNTRKLYHFSISSRGSSTSQIAELLRTVAKEIDEKPNVRIYGITTQDLNDDAEQPSITVYYDRKDVDAAAEEYYMDATTVGPTNAVESLLTDLAKVINERHPKDIYDMTFEAKLNGQDTDYSITMYSD